MAKSYEMRVKVLSIGPVENVTPSFKKREVVGVIEGEYPEYYKFEFVQSKTDVPDSLMEDTYVTIHFNIKGRKVEPQKKGDEPSYFTSLQGWKVEVKPE